MIAVPSLETRPESGQAQPIPPFAFDRERSTLMGRLKHLPKIAKVFAQEFPAA
jgi:hypothetical protein